MKYEGTHRACDRNNQGICDAAQYAILRSEWRKPKHFAEGIVYSTKPLSYMGELIENFSIRFTNGKVSEVEAEKGEALTKENLCEVYYQLNKDYYGEGVTHDKEIAYEWARIPHFYNSFYVYKYATGIISAISIVSRILSEGESAVKDYFTFLQSGGSTDPVSILQRAGVDLTTTKPFEAAMQEFENTLKEFETLSK